ncbi:DUF5605 domain-containing protein [Paenibacillus fonticola]|uniref:DUF5605 domain-containing protein n=1 Tax=Paenibacillus fonticola TaxID=379896 RepID=UPI00037B81A2|nr:DUF5605 domain-containing protein [Paenibacillus fonticola]
MFTEQTKIGRIWTDEAAGKILFKYFPFLKDEEHLAFSYKIFTLGQFLDLREELGFTQAERTALLQELAEADCSPQEGVKKSALKRETHTGYADKQMDGAGLVSSPDSAAQWDVLELSFNGPSEGNPYTDVELSATFTHGDGKRSINVLGFYNGNGSYKVRMMPDREGNWTYRTHSTVKALEGIEGSFICTAPEEGNHGPVRVRDTYHFAYEDGTVYLPFGTTCYAWTHQGEELEQQTLETLAGSPFNKMRMCVFPKSYLYNRNEPPLYPFEGSPEEGWNFRAFNPAFFEHLEQRISDLGRLGIETDLILFHPYDRWGFSEMEQEADDLYLRYIVARLSAYRHVWWSLANEYDLMWAKTGEDWERYAKIITAHDPYGHLLSNHNWLTFYDHSKPWLTHSSIQRIDVYKTSEATLEWRERWNKPVVIDECAYEGDIDQGWGNINGQEMVRRFWEGMIRGGYVGHGETYLNDEEILWWSKGGKLVGDSPARIAFLRKLVEEAPGQRWEPLRSDWDAPCAGVRDNYYMYYFGFNQPKFRIFNVKPGIKYTIEIIDTWNMTIEKCAGLHEGTFRVELPGRQFMAVRLRRADE